MAAITPMMKQYSEIKAAYPDCLLFYRLGDFYEMFGDDAIIASKELEIVLTARDAGLGSKMPMCGVPHHAVDGYLAKLIQKGYKVAICEQTEDPKLAKGIVARSVIRVVTPGTVLENQMLDSTARNYLMAVWREKFLYGIAYTDISTGDFFCTELSAAMGLEAVFDEISRIAPVECIITKDINKDEPFMLRLNNLVHSVDIVANERFVVQNAGSLLKTHYKLVSLEAFGIQGHPCAIYACAAIFDFLNETQKKSLEHLKSIKFYTNEQYMYIDANTGRNLELLTSLRNGEKYGSLLWVLDYTQTAMGARLLKDWIRQPLVNSAAIYLRQQGVQELFDKRQCAKELSCCLNAVYDMERLVSRITSGNTTVRDLLSLKQSIQALPKLFSYLSTLEAQIFKLFINSFDYLDDIYELIEQGINDDDGQGGIIKRGYNADIDELRSIAVNAKDFLRSMEQVERLRTGIKNLKISYNKVFGYYIEVSNGNLQNVPEDYIRKQTLVNAERFITPELKEWENKILNASDKLDKLEAELFEQIRGKVGSNRERIQSMAVILANLDVLQSLAKCAVENDYSCPIIDEGNTIEIREGRHPVIEKIIGHESFIPNDCLLNGQNEQIRLITGPNMCGKSTYMRQTALICLLAKIGSFVPASYARIGAIDRIFTRVGAADDLAAGQSTFMVEMCEAANILRNATPRSLVILDEIGRGTSTFDGISIAWSIAETLCRDEIGAKTLFATHYHELTALEELYPKIKNYSVSVKEKGGDIVFLRKIISGATDKSYGIHVAALAGLPPQTIKRAGEILKQLEQDKGVEITPSLPREEIAFETIISDPIIEELKNIDVNMLSPMAALMKLAEWQQKLK